jgi:hypothetical protein
MSAAAIYLFFRESLGDIQIKTGASDASSPAAMWMVINMSSPTGSDRYHGSPGVARWAFFAQEAYLSH